MYRWNLDRLDTFLVLHTNLGTGCKIRKTYLAIRIFEAAALPDISVRVYEPTVATAGRYLCCSSGKINQVRLIFRMLPSQCAVVVTAQEYTFPSSVTARTCRHPTLICVTARMDFIILGFFLSRILAPSPNCSHSPEPCTKMSPLRVPLGRDALISAVFLFFRACVLFLSSTAALALNENPAPKLGAWGCILSLNP